KSHNLIRVSVFGFSGQTCPLQVHRARYLSTLQRYSVTLGNCLPPLFPTSHFLTTISVRKLSVYFGGYPCQAYNPPTPTPTPTFRSGALASLTASFSPCMHGIAG